MKSELPLRIIMKMFFPFVCSASNALLLLIALLLPSGVYAQTTRDYRSIHSDALVIDMHNDVVQRMLAGEDISKRTGHGHSDLPRFRAGGLDVEFFSIWVPPEKSHKSYTEQADEQIDSVDSFVRRNPRDVALAFTSGDIRRLVGEGKFVAMMGMEGGHPIGTDLRNLDHFYQRGIRYLTLTWNNSTAWSTSAKDETDLHRHLSHKGLTSFGRKVIRRMNDLGMMIDVSHTGERTFWDVIKYTKKPVIASHSSVWELCHHWRNLKDDQLQAIARNGGVACVNFAPWFIDSTFASKENILKARNKTRIDEFSKSLHGDKFLNDLSVAEFLKSDYDSIRPPLSLLIDHIDYMVKLIGIDHVGLGSDFDGITVTPQELDDVTGLPNITRDLLKRGYEESAIKKILGENVMRVLHENEKK